MSNDEREPEDREAPLDPEYTSLPANIKKKARSLFAHEWTWRLFLVSQVLGFVMIVFTDLTNSYWSLIPDLTDYRGRFQFEWDLLNGREWGREKQNWIVLAGIAAPFLLTKAVDWVVSAKENE